jgi:hypothetical protein
LRQCNLLAASIDTVFFKLYARAVELAALFIIDGVVENTDQASKP